MSLSDSLNRIGIKVSQFVTHWWCFIYPESPRNWAIMKGIAMAPQSANLGRKEWKIPTKRVFFFVFVENACNKSFPNASRTLRQCPHVKSINKKNTKMFPLAANRDRLQKGWFLGWVGRCHLTKCHLTPLPFCGVFWSRCPATSLRSLHISGIQHRDASNIWRHQGIPRQSSWSALINNWRLSFLCIAQYQKKARSPVVFDTSRTWASWCSFIVSILTILGSKQTYLFPFGFLEPGSGLSQARLCRVRLIIQPIMS